MVLGVAFDRVVVHDLISSGGIGVVRLVGAVMMLGVAGKKGVLAGSAHNHFICFGFNDALDGAVGTHLNDVAEEITHRRVEVGDVGVDAASTRQQVLKGLGAGARKDAERLLGD